MPDHEYDPEVPYVVEVMGKMLARFVSRGHAEVFSERYATGRVIDTTPKPRVPDDAQFIMWTGRGDRWFAERTSNSWDVAGYGLISAIENLPNVTPETIFTVLDERKTDA